MEQRIYFINSHRVTYGSWVPQSDKRRKWVVIDFPFYLFNLKSRATCDMSSIWHTRATSFIDDDKTYVNAEELDIVVSTLHCSIEEIRASAPVRLYKCDTGSEKFVYTGYCGVATVNLDVDNATLFINMVDLSSKVLVIRQEVYEPFQYEILCSYFHAFEADHFVVGLCFAEQYNATNFLITLLNAQDIVRLTSKSLIVRRTRNRSKVEVSAKLSPAISTMDKKVSPALPPRRPRKEIFIEEEPKETRGNKPMEEVKVLKNVEPISLCKETSLPIKHESQSTQSEPIQAIVSGKQLENWSQVNNELTVVLRKRLYMETDVQLVENDDEDPELLQDLRQEVAKPDQPFTLQDSKLEQIQKKRLNILKEFLSTEKQYGLYHFNFFTNYWHKVGDLHTILTVYYYPSHDKKFLSKESHNTIFNHIHYIVKINGIFFLQLTEVINLYLSSEPPPTIDAQFANLLIRSAPTFRTYSYYINNYDKSHEELQLQKKNNPKFKKFLKQQRKLCTSSGCRITNIEELLIIPVQRLPRYQMLLDDLVRTFLSTDLSYLLLKQAAESIRQVTEYCNEQRREHELKHVTNMVIKSLHLKNFALHSRKLVLEEKKTGFKVAQEGTTSFSIMQKSPGTDSLQSEKKRTASVFSLPSPAISAMRSRSVNSFREEKCDIYIFTDIMVTVINRFPKDSIKFIPLRTGVINPISHTTAIAVKLDCNELRVVISVTEESAEEIVTTLLCPSIATRDNLCEALRKCIGQ